MRELANVVQRATLLAGGDVIDAEDLMLGAGQRTPPARSGVVTAGALRDESSSPRDVESLRFDFASGQFTADAVERHLVCEALRYCQGNVSRAARLLGMNRSSLRYRIEQYHLESLVEELAAQS